MHYDVPMKDRSGRIYLVRMIEDEYICDPQQLPNFDNIWKKFSWLPPGSIKRPKTSIGILLGQNCNILFPGSNEDARHGNMRVRRSLLGDWGYVPDGSDECMWNFERKKRTHLPQNVKPSSLFSLAPDLPWTQLPWFNLFKQGLPSFVLSRKATQRLLDKWRTKIIMWIKTSSLFPLNTWHTPTRPDCWFSR